MILTLLSKMREAYRLWVLRSIWKIKIGNDTYISPKAYLDKNAKGMLSIGNNCFITRDTIILVHSQAKQGGPRALWGKNEFAKVTIGNNVFIGVKTVIMPGITIGDNVIIGACSLVTKDIPSNTVAVGIPAKVTASMADTIPNFDQIIHS